MMKAALVLAGVIALSGCTSLHAPSDWTKPAATVQQVTFDDMECERQSREVPGTPDLIVGGIVGLIVISMYLPLFDVYNNIR